jgi:hypothetical protein
MLVLEAGNTIGFGAIVFFFFFVNSIGCFFISVC